MHVHVHICPFQIVSDDGIASVKQIVIDLTTDEKHVDLEFSVSVAPRMCTQSCHHNDVRKGYMYVRHR